MSNYTTTIQMKLLIMWHEIPVSLTSIKIAFKGLYDHIKSAVFLHTQCLYISTRYINPNARGLHNFLFQMYVKLLLFAFKSNWTGNKWSFSCFQKFSISINVKDITFWDASQWCAENNLLNFVHLKNYTCIVFHYPYTVIKRFFRKSLKSVDY